MRTPLRKSFWHVALACTVTLLAALAAWRSPRTQAAAPAGAATDSPPAPRRVKVLFLGDKGHHVPLERARQIYSVLGRRGIDLTYTDSLADLNSQTLGRGILQGVAPTIAAQYLLWAAPRPPLHTARPLPRARLLLLRWRFLTTASSPSVAL